MAQGGDICPSNGSYMWGIWTAFWTRGRGIWPLKIKKFKCPGVCPVGECWCYKLIGALAEQLMYTPVSHLAKHRDKETEMRNADHPVVTSMHHSYGSWYWNPFLSRLHWPVSASLEWWRRQPGGSTHWVQLTHYHTEHLGTQDYRYTIMRKYSRV